MKIGRKRSIGEYQPRKFELERTNVWSFPEGGGNSPKRLQEKPASQMVRNLILRYSKPEERILDQICGSGTVLKECKILGRRDIGVDINYDYINANFDRLNFDYTH